MEIMSGCFYSRLLKMSWISDSWMFSGLRFSKSVNLITSDYSKRNVEE